MAEIVSTYLKSKQDTLKNIDKQIKENNARKGKDTRYSYSTKTAKKLKQWRDKIVKDINAAKKVSKSKTKSGITSGRSLGKNIAAGRNTSRRAAISKKPARTTAKTTTTNKKTGTTTTKTTTKTTAPRAQRWSKALSNFAKRRDAARKAGNTSQEKKYQALINKEYKNLGMNKSGKAVGKRQPRVSRPLKKMGPVITTKKKTTTPTKKKTVSRKNMPNTIANRTTTKRYDRKKK